MFAAGAGLIVIGYAMLWTGVNRFRGQPYSLVEAVTGFKDGKDYYFVPKKTDTSGDVAPSSATGTGPTANAVPA